MKKVALLALFFVVLQGCNGNFRGTVPGSDSALAEAVTALDGTWGRSDCQPRASGGFGDYTDASTYSAGQGTTKVIYYYTSASAGSCAQAALTVSTSFLYQTRTSGLASDILEVDTTYTSQTYTPADGNVANFLNGAHYLGHTDWQAGAPITIDAMSNPSDFVTGEYDIVRVSGNVAYWGNTSSGDKSSPERRPTQLDYTDYQNLLN